MESDEGELKCMIVGWPQVTELFGMFLMEPNCADYLLCVFTVQASICNHKYVQQKGKAWEHNQTTRLNNHRKATMGNFTPNLLLPE